jgi:hypothetical protein
MFRILSSDEILKRRAFMPLTWRRPFSRDCDASGGIPVIGSTSHTHTEPTL